MKKITLIFLVGLLTFDSCTTDPETKILDNREEIIVNDNITSNTTWYGDKIYLVTTSIDINSRAVLTIEPGCIIKFSEDTELDISYNDYGTIQAIGTEENPILFTSDSPKKQAGDWYGFYFYDGCEGSEFQYCTIEYAGGYSDDPAAVNLRGGYAKFINCTVRESASFGYEARQGTYFNGFAYNTVTKTKYDPMKITTP